MKLPLLIALAGFSAVELALPQSRPKEELRDKTLVVWTAPANLTQRGGSVLTIEKPGGVFDAIVLGEIAPGKWMPGSDSFKRTKQDQQNFPSETASANTYVQVAVACQNKAISLYRNGVLAATYPIENEESFSAESFVLMGLRHTEAAPENRYFTGVIEDARIYKAALTAAQISDLKPNQPSEPPPLAWWDFENGSASDRMKSFPVTTLYGDARVRDGKLHLVKPGAYLLASRESSSTSGAPGGTDLNALARGLREKLLSDPSRPGYHFVIPEGQAMPFDPNGAVFWKGRYHLFYIFQDKRGHNWGHVSSTDLFHWRHHPTGLVSGMFSGNCFINKDGRPTMCYHQVGQGNALAVALDDDLNEWQKLDSNPITPKTQPGDPHHSDYRSWDPFGWVEGDTYYAIFGGERPAVVKSSTMSGPWRYVGDLMANSVPGVSINEDVSCADFFPLGHQRMLLCISHRLGCRYYLGEWKGEQFHPSFHEKMSWTDNSFFAPESLLDDRGRRIMWAWIFDSPGFKMRTEFGWSGTMSLPRVLSLSAEGALLMRPPEEIERLRYHEQKQERLSVAPGSDLPLPGIRGNSLELNCEINSATATQYGIKVCCSPGNEEHTSVYYDRAEKKLKIDTTRSSLGESPKTVEGGPLELKEGEPLRLRIFVDKSVVEVFANDRQAVMRRIYPSRPDSLEVKAYATGGSAEFTSVRAWQMSPSNAF